MVLVIGRLKFLQVNSKDMVYERYPCPEFELYRSVYKTDGFPRNECMLIMKSDMWALR